MQYDHKGRTYQQSNLLSKFVRDKNGFFFCILDKRDQTLYLKLALFFKAKRYER